MLFGKEISTLGSDYAALWMTFSAVGEIIITVERYHSVLRGIPSVLWRIFSTVEGNYKHFGYYLHSACYILYSTDILHRIE